jgi:penicillin G amidase
VRRWVSWLLGSSLTAGIVLFLLGWLTLRASLPELDGGIAVTGLAAAATIERDDAGIPTITAANRQDLAFATGFAHGQDRFFQMDLLRRQAAGELAELFGRALLDSDRRFRFHRFRSRARQALEQLPEAHAAILESYARGVNAGLASLDARPFEYYLLRTQPAPWRAEDSILIVYTMFMMLNDERATGDIRRGLAHHVLPEAVYAWMYPDGTDWDAPLMGDARVPAEPPPAAVYSVRRYDGDSVPANEIGKPQLNGSNNWAVAGALTATGRAIVSNDMHLGLSEPNIYYRARLIVDRGDGIDVSGVTLPGAPFVVAGSNGKVAWGYTNSYGDWSDAVILRPGSTPDSYRTPQGERSYEVYRETIAVRGDEPDTLTVRETVWGPVLDDVDYPDGKIAVSWTGHKADAVNLRLIDMESAPSVDEALRVASTLGIPPQNFVAGDADGNIGWTIAGRIPVRSSYDARLPADWSETAGWLGWLGSDSYPRIVNPPSGRLWTANARVADGTMLAVVGDGGYDLGARARQIRDALFASERFAPQDMLAIQCDDRALFLARWRDMLLGLLDDDTVAQEPQLAAYRELVADWLPRAAPESVGYRLVRAFRLEVQARVFYGLMAPVREAYGDDVELRISNQFEAPLWTLVTERPQHLLPGGYEDWRELLLAAVRQNIGYFEEHFDGPLAKRNWGERNTVRIRHPMSGALPLLARFLDVPGEPLNGDVDMPRAQGPTFGASERFSVAPGDEANGLMHMPTGQSGHPLSDFYRRGHQDWVHGRPTPFLPGTVRHTLQLQPDAGGRP